MKKFKLFRCGALFCALLGLGFLIQRYSAPFYQEPILKIQQVVIREDEQLVTGVLLNGADKGRHVQAVSEYLVNQATHTPHQVGDQVFLAKTYDWIVTEAKRDGYLFILGAGFVCALLLIGGSAGVRSLVSLLVNTLLLLFAAAFNSHFGAVPLLLVMLCYSGLAVSVSFLCTKGWRQNSWQKIGATWLSVLVSFGICWSAMTLLNDRGLRYEEMNYLSRPLRPLFLASLLIGTIGAAMDTVITVFATLEELTSQNPGLSGRELRRSGKTVGQDIAGSMINVLLFAYLSGSLPILLFYLANSWRFFATLELHLSLEFLRALSGGFAIVLAVPISLGIFLTARNWQLRRVRT